MHSKAMKMHIMTVYKVLLDFMSYFINLSKDGSSTVDAYKAELLHY